MNFKHTQHKKTRGISIWILFFILVYAVFVIKFITLNELNNNILLAIYSIGISFYILSRFALGYLYVPQFAKFDLDYEPTVTFAVPSKNEEENIRETIERIASVDYPANKFNIIVVNDGSTDNTLAQMHAAKESVEKKFGVEVVVVDWKVNKGKREGMAECVLRSKNDIMIFIDSDSFVDPEIVRESVKYFKDPKIGAVAGHAYVANPDVNLLTKMQAVRYFVAFKAYKAAEALFGTVTCCSGCCAAYRRDYVVQVLDEFRYEKFLGQQCTYGDDRSLTNALIRHGYSTVFSPTAIAYTFVPETMKQFLKQQLRWKKSWTKESIKASFFIWKKNPIMSISFYLGFLLPLVAPIIVVRALIWYPIVTHRVPWFYIIGVGIMSVIYGLYYYIYTKDKKWVYGVVFAVFYGIIFIWQLPYAILTIRDTRWGTR
jgi:hyaluronan synthase